MEAALQELEIEQPTQGVLLPQPPAEEQDPGMMVEPRGPLLGVQHNAATPPMGQHTKPPLPSVTYHKSKFERDLKWKSDELLGDQGDTSMILYANKEHPNLKIEYPIFDDRIKQIAKIWMNLPPNKRQPYSTAARENHRARCINWQVIPFFFSKCRLLFPKKYIALIKDLCIRDHIFEIARLAVKAYY